VEPHAVEMKFCTFIP